MPDPENGISLTTTSGEDLSDILRSQYRKYASSRAEAGSDNVEAFDVEAARGALAQTSATLPAKAVLERRDVNGVSVVDVSPETLHSADDIILYFHGGGFVAGDWNSHGQILAWLSEYSGLRGVFVNYRLAPEHKFPAAFEDVVQVIEYYGRRSRKVFLAGDSVGCALALYASQLLLDSAAYPGAIAMFSGMTDYRESRSAYLQSSGRARAMLKHALADLRAKDARLDPHGSKFEDLAPTLIQIGGADHVKGDGLSLANHLMQQGHPVIAEMWPLMPHVWHRYAGSAPEADSALKRAARFFREQS